MNPSAEISNVQQPASGKPPRVSIGIPVRNGQRYINQAIDSLLVQTFGDFEIIICDNASTDATEQICRDFEARDSRVKYYRNETDLGPAGNHNRCFQLSRGEYFRWHAHDDMCAPEYLQRCVEVLDQSPSTVICHSLTRVIDEQSQPRCNYEFVWKFDAPRPSARFSDFILVNHKQHVGYEIFGLMRRNVLQTTRLQGGYAHGDRVLLARMSLRGRFHEVPHHLFWARAHANQSMQAKTTRAKYLAFLGTGPLPPYEWWDKSKLGKIVYPEWKLLGEYLKAISEVELPISERVQCHAAVVRWILKNLPKLGRDLAYAIEHILTRRGASAASQISQPPVPAR